MTPIEKRKAIIEYGKIFGQGGIRESGGENQGPDLVNYIQKFYSGYKLGTPWCAAYISALSGMVDKDYPSGPMSKYRTSGSQYGGAGVIKNMKEAKPGMVISWKNLDDDNGHAALILEVSDTGIKTSEGNTSVSVKKPDEQIREGGETRIKTYTWEKVKAPSERRRFSFICKIWEEDSESLADNLPDKSYVDSSKVQTGGGSGGENSNTNISTKPRMDLSKLILDMSGLPDTAEQLKKVNKVSDVSVNKSTSDSTEHEAKQIINPNVNFVDPINQNS